MARHCETSWFEVSEIAKHSASLLSEDRSFDQATQRALADEVADAEAKQTAPGPDTVSIPLKIQWPWFQTGKAEKTGSHRPPVRRHTCVTTTGGREFNPRPGQYSRMSFSCHQVTLVRFPHLNMPFLQNSEFILNIVLVGKQYLQAICAFPL